MAQIFSGILRNLGEFGRALLTSAQSPLIVYVVVINILLPYVLKPLLEMIPTTGFYPIDTTLDMLTFHGEHALVTSGVLFFFIVLATFLISKRALVVV